MIETHPFGSFVPEYTKYLLLGSFTTKEAFDDEKKEAYKWFYSNGGRNQFWPILEEVYKTKLQSRSEMQELMSLLGIAVSDIIYQCERKKRSNLDINLINIVYAVEDITKIVQTNDLSRIFFTSRFVEKKFRSVFKNLILIYPNIDLVTLPSPSPRYVQMTRAQKIEKYKEALPLLSKP